MKDLKRKLEGQAPARAEAASSARHTAKPSPRALAGGWMRLTIEMGNPEQTILEELTNPALRLVTQQSVAITYAFLMAQQGNDADWTKINSAIRARWKSPTALERVKKLAWKQLEEWHERGKAQSAGGAV